MVFLPAFLSNAYAAIYFLKHRRGLAEFIFFWGSMGLTLLAFTILYRATRNHFRTQPERLPASSRLSQTTGSDESIGAP
jgi:hypothetical protein